MTTRGTGGSARPAVAGPTLRDLLSLPALDGARVVGREGLDEPVAVLVPADRDAPGEPGALVVAAGGPPDPLPDGCVAVVCREEPPMELSVPVVVLSDGTPWGPVVADLAAALCSGSGWHRAAEARAAFRPGLLEGRGYEALAVAARDLLGAPVALLDEQLESLATAGLGMEQEGELAAAVDSARSHVPAPALGSFMQDELHHTVRHVWTDPLGTSGVLVVWLPGAPSDAEMAVIDEWREAVLLERARDQARVETEAQLRGELVDELLAGEQVSRESLVRRGRLLGAELSQGAVALIGKLQDPHTEGRVITDPRLVRRFMAQTRGVLDLHWPRSLVDWHDGLLIVLLPPRGEIGAEESPEDLAHTLARRLLAATRQTVPGLALTLALSRHAPEPERLGAALDEAQLALSIGERLGRAGQVVTFEETGTYKLLFQIFADRPEELSAFYDQTLGPLVRYDEQYQTELVTTLATYLELDGNLAATAGRLFTHRHTVRYRLDRITELSGLDISRTDDREKLSLGLKAMRLLGRRVRTGPAGERPTRGQAGRTSKP